MANNNKNVEPKVDETKAEKPKVEETKKKDVKPLKIRSGLIVL